MSLADRVKPPHRRAEALRARQADRGARARARHPRLDQARLEREPARALAAGDRGDARAPRPACTAIPDGAELPPAREALRSGSASAPNQLVFGCGADELLELVAKAFLAPGRRGGLRLAVVRDVPDRGAGHGRARRCACRSTRDLVARPPGARRGGHAAHARRLRLQPEQPDRHERRRARPSTPSRPTLPDDVVLRRRRGLPRVRDAPGLPRLARLARAAARHRGAAHLLEDLRAGRRARRLRRGGPRARRLSRARAPSVQREPARRGGGPRRARRRASTWSARCARDARGRCASSPRSSARSGSRSGRPTRTSCWCARAPESTTALLREGVIVRPLAGFGHARARAHHDRHAARRTSGSCAALRELRGPARERPRLRARRRGRASGLLGGSVAAAARARGVARRVVGVARRPRDGRRGAARRASSTRSAASRSARRGRRPRRARDAARRDARAPAPRGAGRSPRARRDRRRQREGEPRRDAAGPAAAGRRATSARTRWRAATGAASTHARADLFEGAPCVVAPAPGTPPGRGRARARLLRGARRARRACATPSATTPRSPGSAICPTRSPSPSPARSRAPRPAPPRVRGPGFRDFTRIAHSDPELWAEILCANRKALAGPLARAAARLAELARALEQGDARGGRTLPRGGARVPRALRGRRPIRGRQAGNSRSKGALSQPHDRIPTQPARASPSSSSSRPAR